MTFKYQRCEQRTGILLITTHKKPSVCVYLSVDVRYMKLHWKKKHKMKLIFQFLCSSETNTILRLTSKLNCLCWQRVPLCEVWVMRCVRHHGSPIVQCSPVQPWWQSHLPSRQTPWSMQRGWQSLCSHSGPVQPSSQWHIPLMHEPWGPQSTTHTSVAKAKPSHTDNHIVMQLLYCRKPTFFLPFSFLFFFF